MIVIFAIALIYVSTMDGCSEHPPEVVPVEAPALGFGAYTVTVTGVERVSCGAARADEFLGLSADGWLAPDGQGGADAVRFDLDGLSFRGGMAEGALRLHSALGAAPPVETEAAPPASSTADAQGCAPDSADARPPAPEATLSATVIDAAHATGLLDVHTADCSYVLDVVLEAAVDDTAVVDPRPDDTGAVEPGDTGAVGPGDTGADDTGAVEPGDDGADDTGDDAVPPGTDDGGCG